MLVSSRASRLALGILVLCFARPADAQENLDQGKTAAQMFAANCVVCHKKPQGLARPGASGLDIFLRQHYTASRESAAAIAAYLQSVGPAKKNAKGEELPKGAEKKPKAVKPGETKPGEAKPADAKSGDAKSGDAKPGDAKNGESKPAEPKASEPTSSELKALETKPSETKPSETKPSETKASAPIDAKPAEPKPDKSD